MSANTAGGSIPDAYRAWQRETQGMRQAAARKSWTAKELTGINPKDIGVMLGPVLTEEQFKALGKRADKIVVRSVVHK